MTDFSQLFQYDPSSPTFIINKITRSNKAVQGMPAGTTWGKGHQVRVNGTTYQISRIVWELHNGPIPEGMLIAFRDYNRHNCSIENLMLSTRRQKALRSNWKPGKSGHVGVTVTDNGKFVSAIRYNKELIHLGTFKSIQEAKAARASAIKMSGGTLPR